MFILDWEVSRPSLRTTSDFVAWFKGVLFQHSSFYQSYKLYPLISNCWFVKMLSNFVSKMREIWELRCISPSIAPKWCIRCIINGALGTNRYWIWTNENMALTFLCFELKWFLLKIIPENAVVFLLFFDCFTSFTLLILFALHCHLIWKYLKS